MTKRKLPPEQEQARLQAASLCSNCRNIQKWGLDFCSAHMVAERHALSQIPVHSVVGDFAFPSSSLLIKLFGKHDRPIIEELLRLHQQRDEGLIDNDTMSKLIEGVTGMEDGYYHVNVALHYIKVIETQLAERLRLGESVDTVDRRGATYIATRAIRDVIVRVVDGLNLQYRDRDLSTTTDDSEFFDEWWDGRG